jgi:hypothetical protein
MTKNIEAARKSLTAEVEAGHQDHDDVMAYLDTVDALIDQARAVKQLYKNEIAREASKKSRAKKAAEVEAMAARLAELEAAAAGK